MYFSYPAWVLGLFYPQKCLSPDSGYHMNPRLEGMGASNWLLWRTSPSHRLNIQPNSILSVASIKALQIPGSLIECPASGTTINSASGQARCNSQADIIGQTTS